MLHWARRVFDIRSGEGLPVVLAFVYIAVVVSAFLLAKPIRNGLFLNQYGPALIDRLRDELPLEPGKHWVIAI